MSRRGRDLLIYALVGLTVGVVGGLIATSMIDPDVVLAAIFTVGFLAVVAFAVWAYVDLRAPGWWEKNYPAIFKGRR